MRLFGQILVGLGFLGGALVAVLETDAVALNQFLPFLLLGVAGVVTVQLAMKREASHGGKIEANLEELAEALSRIVDSARKLEQEKSSLSVYDLPGRIDEWLPNDVTRFVDIRDAMSHAWGSQTYGNIMSHFAAAERYTNRVWSAASDGYIDEAHTYVDRAREQFEEAKRLFEAARSSASS